MIAKTIIQQLGNIALSMLGAYLLVDLGDGLQFRFKGCKKSNMIQITLDPCDTYTVKFWKATVTKRKLNDHESFNMMEWALDLR